MNIIVGTALLITSLLFTIVICIVAMHKGEIWSYIIFEDEEDYEDCEDNDLDEYYE